MLVSHISIGPLVLPLGTSNSYNVLMPTKSLPPSELRRHITHQMANVRYVTRLSINQPGHPNLVPIRYDPNGYPYCFVTVATDAGFVELRYYPVQRRYQVLESSLTMRAAMTSPAELKLTDHAGKALTSLLSAKDTFAFLSSLFA